MKKRLEEIERNMESILEDVNKVSGSEYLSIEFTLWPANSKPFRVNLWDGENHAALNQSNYYGTFEELNKWFILHQKFNKVG